jgi:RNA polymerase sigma-70 factor, ECF subfamily
MPHRDAKPPAQRFLELLEPIEAELEAYARRLLWDSQDVPDALHNCMARAIAAFDRFQVGTNFRAWMFKILTHEVFALNRKHQKLALREFQMDAAELSELADSRQPIELLPNNDDAWEKHLDEELVCALRCLTEPERAVLLLRSLGSFSYQEIALNLDMPLGSVIGYLGRARRKMRLLLAGSNWSGKESKPL